mmetsp:Transcript_35700/g.66492  ORF Transcript_35700/g.66492 Transcript_35700/m.66492 type:complete len:308 (+) Transcript_35700:260-1183(+)
MLVFGIHRVAQQDSAIVVYGFDQNLRLSDGQVVETILRFAVPIHGIVRVWRGLRGDPTATTSDDAGHAHVVLVPIILAPKLLVMPMARDQQIQSALPQLAVEVLLMPAGEVRDHNLPRGRGLRKDTTHPNLLLLPEGLKPARAGFDRLGAPSGRTRGPRPVVLGAAHVVVWVLFWRHGVDEIRVKEVIVDIKAQVLVDDRCLVVRRGQHPTVAEPGIGQLLVPTIVELEASPVMVSEDTEPWLLTETRSLVHSLKDLIELVLGGIRDLIHRRATRFLDATPVKVVPNVEDVLGIHLGRPGLERLCDQ